MGRRGRPSSDERGYGSEGTSLIEVFIAIGILALLMSAAYGSLVAQMRTHATQMMVAETMYAGRSALNLLVDQVSLAGFGVPAATNPSRAPIFITAEKSRLSFWADASTVHTFLVVSATKGSRDVTVVSAVGTRVGDSVYLSDSDVWYVGTVESIDGKQLRLGPKLSANFVAGSFLAVIEQIEFQLVGGELRRNGHPLARNVRSLEFTYDAKDLAAIRVVGVRLELETRDIDPATHKPVALSLSAEVAPRNLAL
jgi:hypothetical protein